MIVRNIPVEHLYPAQDNTNQAIVVTANEDDKWLIQF